MASVSHKKIVGRWLYSDESNGVSEGMLIEFTRPSSQSSEVKAAFIIQDQLLEDTRMECTLNAEGIIIEENGAEISNRYEGTVSEDGKKISGSWTCTKSTMEGVAEGDSGKFELAKDPSSPAVAEEAPEPAEEPKAKAKAKASEKKEEPKPAPELRFKGRWSYTDDFTPLEDGTALGFILSDSGKLSASFIVEEEESEADMLCELTKDGMGVTIKEDAGHIATDYVGVLSTDGLTIAGTWTCIRSEDDQETAVGDAGAFTLTKCQ